MKQLFVLVIFLISMVFAGCTHQARKTHLVFEKDDATYGELATALDELKPVGYKGATHEQFRVVKALRHLAKYMEDPGKREMALRALVFLTYFNDDNDVTESCNSRLETVLEDDDEDLALRIAVIDATKGIVTGKLGYTIEESSIFSDTINHIFVFPEADFREDALEFLMDEFEEIPEYLQYKMVEAFQDILTNSVNCLEKTEQGCDEDDSEDQEEWKQRLWKEIGKWLEDDAISSMIKLSLIRMAEIIPNVKEKETGETWLQEWRKSEEFPESTKLIIEAAISKSKGEFTALNRQKDSKDEQSVKTSIKHTFKPDESYQLLGSYDQNAFWYGNSEKILEQQLFQKEKSVIGSRMIPVDWIVFSGYGDSDESKELREIVYHTVVKALKTGYLISGPEMLVSNLRLILESADEYSIWKLDKVLAIVGNSYNSLRAQKEDIKGIIDILENGARDSQSVYARRLYLNTMINGLLQYQHQIEPVFCPLLNESDILTRHLMHEQLRTLPLIKPSTPA
ncbi:hypothetical protein KKA14_04225, partial [bacterium]|nr:hypothetical protein [bacterium]